MTIGEALKQERLHAGLTQTQMTAGLISESFYSKVERGVHSIDADTLINILSANHIDAIHFFTLIINQKSSINPNFDIIGKIIFAQNKKDLKTLDKISADMKSGKIQSSFHLQLRLENAYAWILHSNKMVSPEMKKKVKSLILDKNWNRPAYHYLSQAVILLDIDEAYYLVKSAFAAFKKNKKYDVFTLQFVALIAVNFLNCCYHQHADKKYTKLPIEFLHNMPVDPVIGIQCILGTYYEALFDHDTATAQMIVTVLKKAGYISVIQDTLD